MFCYSCDYLNKQVKEHAEHTNHYIYGCSNGKRNRIVGWIAKDNELKLQGCSNWKERRTTEQDQISIFDMI